MKKPLIMNLSTKPVLEMYQSKEKSLVITPTTQVTVLNLNQKRLSLLRNLLSVRLLLTLLTPLPLRLLSRPLLMLLLVVS